MNVSSIERELTAEEYRRFFDLASAMPRATIDGICAQIWGWRIELEGLSRAAIARRIRLIRLEFDAQRASANQLKAFQSALGGDGGDLNELLASLQLQTILKEVQSHLPEFELKEQLGLIDSLRGIYATFAKVRHSDKKSEIDEAKLEIDSNRAELEERRVSAIETQLRMKIQELDDLKTEKELEKSKLNELQTRSGNRKLDAETLRIVREEVYGVFE